MECSLQVPIKGVETRSFQFNTGWSQPVMIWDLWIRSQVEISPTAFIGVVREQALHHFTLVGGVCQQLAGQDGLIRSGSQYYSQAAGQAGSFLKPGPCWVSGTRTRWGTGSSCGRCRWRLCRWKCQEVCCAVKRGVKGCRVLSCTDQT